MHLCFVTVTGTCETTFSFLLLCVYIRVTFKTNFQDVFSAYGN